MDSPCFVIVAFVSLTVALAAVVWTVTSFFNAVPLTTPSFAVESVSALLWIPVIFACVGVIAAFVDVMFTTACKCDFFFRFPLF